MIGLFGGSFNPPHRGHLEFVRYALKQKGIERVWVIPCFEHPFGKKLVPFEHRLQMCRLQFSPFGSQVEVLEVERDLGGKSLSLRTVQHLKALYPEEIFHLLIGADLANEISRWNDSEKLLKEIELFIVPRGKNSPVFDVSASEIRSKISSDEDLKTILTEEVRGYIEKHQLYR